VFLRQLEYLTALAHERHFGHAAKACHVSQPALSAAIRKLERELGVALVIRQQRHVGLTPEGRALLPWAQQALASLDGLTAEAARLRHNLTGTLRLGVIPTALSVVSLITGRLLERHPGVRVEVRALSSIEIGRRLADHDLDAGVTYLDNEPLGAVLATPIYEERYLFLTQSEQPRGSTIGWSELKGVPLCLLTRDMQNRRIIDAALRDAGVEAAARVEANSISALLSFAQTGWSCVMAQTWLALQGPPAGMRSLALTDPDITHTVGLVAPETDLVHPIVRALRDELSTHDIDTELAQRSRAAPPIPGHE
jgi:DNA-binding transcriptional LysR family regulator